MKKIDLIKIAALFLFLIFTLQVMDITCIDEASFGISAAQKSIQLKAGDVKASGISVPQAVNHCQCPCHLCFLPAFLTVVSFLPAGSSAVAIQDSSISKISADFFQPPKALI